MTGQPGDIGLVSVSGLVGRAIRIGQWLNGDGWSRYEHAFVAVDPGTVVQAQPGGAVRAPMPNLLVMWLSCPDQYRDGVVKAALELVGTPYSFADYAALAAVRLHLPSKRLRAYVKSTGHMICSQLCDEAARRGGWHLFTDGRLPQDVTPGDLWQLARTIPTQPGGR